MEYYEVIARILMSIVVGGLIGSERQMNNRPAGFRTHILVCVGAAIVSIIQVETIERTIYMIEGNPILANALKADIGRMGAQVITGVGFLGAGTIVQSKGVVKGLTTAATLWVVACIGLAIGLGLYFVSVASTISVMLALVFLKKFEARFIGNVKTYKLDIDFVNNKEIIKQVEKYFQMENIIVQSIQLFSKSDEMESNKVQNLSSRVICTIEAPKYIDVTKMVSDICNKKDVNNVTIIYD